MKLISFLRALFRFIGFLLITLLYLGKLFIQSTWKGMSLDLALAIRKEWARIILPTLGVDLDTRGPIPKGPALLVSNHRSYLDPILMLHDAIALPVSKAEVSKWPLIGYAARLTGVLFVDRANKANRTQTLKKITDTILNGRSIINFAEGTTHDAPTTIAFKSGAFRMAAKENIPVVPIALDYQDRRDAWIGDDTFIPHFFQTFGRPRTFAKISYGTAIQSNDAQQLLSTTKNWIDRELLAFRSDWDE